MTYGKIINALPVLRRLAGEPLTIKTAYWLDKTLRVLEGETAFFDKHRADLVQKYGTELENGNWKIAEDKADAFGQEMAELLSLETAAEWEVVKIPTTENITLSCNEIRALDGVVELDFVEE